MSEVKHTAEAFERSAQVAETFFDDRTWRARKPDGTPRKQFTAEEVKRELRWASECIAAEIRKQATAKATGGGE